MTDVAIGIDAITRVLHKARKEGMHAFGHSYKKKGRASHGAHV